MDLTKILLLSGPSGIAVFSAGSTEFQLVAIFLILFALFYPILLFFIISVYNKSNYETFKWN